MIVSLSAEYVADCARIMTQNTLWQNYDITQADAEAQLKSGLESSDARILIRLEDELATGFIWYYIKGTFHRGAYIRLIGIHPDYQRKGIGTQLMAVAEADIMTRTPHVFLLSSDFNEDAHRFYDRLGYTSVGELADFAKEGITEIIFVKRLK